MTKFLTWKNKILEYLFRNITISDVLGKSCVNSSDQCLRYTVFWFLLRYERSYIKCTFSCEMNRKHSNMIMSNLIYQIYFYDKKRTFDFDVSQRMHKNHIKCDDQLCIWYDLRNQFYIHVHFEYLIILENINIRKWILKTNFCFVNKYQI